MPTKKNTTKRKWVDPDDAPELTEEWFRTADYYKGGKLVRRGRPKSDAPKEAVNIRLDPDVERLDTGTLIMMAIGAYLNLFPQITPEMEVFHVFNAAEAGIRDGIRERYRDILDMLEKPDTDGRRAVCQEWLSKLKSKHYNGGAG